MRLHFKNGEGKTKIIVARNISTIKKNPAHLLQNYNMMKRYWSDFNLYMATEGVGEKSKDVTKQVLNILKENRDKIRE